MRKLLIILLTFLAVFTCLRTFDRAEASVNPDEIIEIPIEISVEIQR